MSFSQIFSFGSIRLWKMGCFGIRCFSKKIRVVDHYWQPSVHEPSQKIDASYLAECGTLKEKDNVRLKKMPNLSPAPQRLSINNGGIFRAINAASDANNKTECERDLQNVNGGNALYLYLPQPLFNLFPPSLLPSFRSVLLTTFPFTSRNTYRICH